MIILNADTRALTAGAKYSYLSATYAAGVSSLTVTNADAFAANDYVVLGEIGFEQCEIVQVNTVNTSTQVITLVAATVFPHTESSRVAVTPFNKVRFFWTATETYATTTPLTGYIALQPNDWFTKYVDNSQSTGYGWFIYQNSTTGFVSSNSNSIPYANFSRSTVKSAIDGFYSLINNNEQKLITYDDALEWLNEAHDIAKNDLDLSNNEFNASDGTDTVSVVASTAEYALAANFGTMISVWVNNTPGVTNGTTLDPMDLADVDANNLLLSGVNPRWYIRGGYIGFTPAPTSAYTVYYRYQKTAADLTSYSDVITLPRKAYHLLKTYMLHKAKIKLRHADAMATLGMFEKGIEKMRLQAVNRDSSLDSFGQGVGTNV